MCPQIMHVLKDRRRTRQNARLAKATLFTVTNTAAGVVSKGDFRCFHVFFFFMSNIFAHVGK